MANILICDDERDIVSALKIYLSSEGYTLFEAYTGREAPGGGEEARHPPSSSWTS